MNGHQRKRGQPRTKRCESIKEAMSAKAKNICVEDAHDRIK